MAHLFQPDRSLLYPQFETYRLRSLDVDEDTASYRLLGNGATQSSVGYNNHHLSFKEVRGRIGWDHLAVGSGGRAVYIDVDWKVIGLQLDVCCPPASCCPGTDVVCLGSSTTIFHRTRFPA